MLAAGDVLGDCEILAPLGKGGMGEVYLARDLRLGRKVAVKVLPASFAADAARLSRFEREAKSASALNHPNICTIHALGELADGRRFIVMEHVEGTTLRALLTRGPVELARVVDVGRQMATGLAAAHEAGVVHRDVKPENVMVRADGLVKILDFGLAKILPDSALAAGESTHTAARSSVGAVVGTVQYMSPEQARGEPIDARTDVWGLGAVLYEMVAGQPAFGGRTASDIVANVLHAEPPPLARFSRECPPELQRIVSKCLRKDQPHRYQTTRDVALDLEALGDADPAPAPVAQRTRRWIGLAAVVAAVALAAAGGWWLWMRWPAPERTRSAGSGQPELKRLTFDAGLQTDVSFSPDGRFIAYASDRSGNFDIWVQRVDGGDAVQITKEPAQDVQPAWSPDGNSIAFRSERGGGGIFVMPALGGHARQVSAFGSHPSWLSRSEVLFLVGNPEGIMPGQLFVVPVSGETPRELLHDFLLGSSLYWAAGHPDGRISVLLEGKRGFGLFTVSRDGQAVTASHIPPSLPIHRGRTHESTPMRFHWNPSGTALYLEGNVDGIQNLWRVAVDPRSLAWLSMERLTTGPGRDTAVSLSADGTRLAYTTSNEHTRVYVQSLSADGRTLTGSPVAVTEADAEAFTSALSNDGRRLAYIVRRAGSARFEIRIAELDTGKSALLDEDVLGAVALNWSADGSAVLHPRVREGEAQLMRHDLGGRETVLVPWSSAIFLGGPTASGREFIGSVYRYSGEPAEVAIWALDGEGSLKPHRVLLADPTANLWEASYVPGTRWMSFLRQPLDQAQRTELMIGPAGGGPPSTWRRLVPDHREADKPRWSADGHLMYFLSRGSGEYFNLWALPFDPLRGVSRGTAFQVSAFVSPALFVSRNVGRMNMEVQNRRVALTMSSATGSIWMLEGIGAGENHAGQP